MKNSYKKIKLNDPLISHVFTFTTPSILTGDKLAFDIGVKLWDVEGPQVKLDNLVVTNFSTIPEPSLLIIYYLLVIICTQNKFSK